MRALELAAHDIDGQRAAANLRVVEKTVPQPGPGQVLIRVEAAPCNPSDLSFLQGTYSVDRPLPAVPGFEAAGVVVRTGSGLMARRLLGKRVSCAGQGKGDGTWAEFFLAEAMQCLPLRKGVSFEQGSCLVVNPLTAFGLLERARHFGSRAIIQNAAASQLARMIATLAKEKNMAVIHVVRRREQVERLKSEGAVHVLDSARADFVPELTRLTEAVGATTALDAVGGEMTGQLLAALPARSQVVLYGGLSGENPSVRNRDIVFRRSNLSGFHLARHIEERGMLWALWTFGKVQRRVKSGVLATQFGARLSLSQAADGLADYARSMTGGKVLILPGKR